MGLACPHTGAHTHLTVLSCGVTGQQPHPAAEREGGYWEGALREREREREPLRPRGDPGSPVTRPCQRAEVTGRSEETRSSCRAGPSAPAGSMHKGSASKPKGGRRRPPGARRAAGGSVVVCLLFDVLQGDGQLWAQGLVRGGRFHVLLLHAHGDDCRGDGGGGGDRGCECNTGKGGLMLSLLGKGPPSLHGASG